MSSKPGIRSARQRACEACERLFRPDVGIAAGAAGRRNHRRVAGIGRRRADFRIDARRRAQHAVGLRQFVAERLGAPARSSCPARGACRRGAHLRIGAQLLGARRSAARSAPAASPVRRRLRAGRARTRPSSTQRENERVFDLHDGKRPAARGCSAAEHANDSGFAIADQRKMPHRRHRAALGELTPPCLAAQLTSRAHGNSGRQPSRRASGANASSKMRRGPLSAPM